MGLHYPKQIQSFTKKKIMVIPDILANSGGVCISYLEWVQNNMGYYWSFDEVAGKMEANIVRGLKDTHDISKKYKIDMRRAANGSCSRTSHGSI